jgi:hypothetical protein
MLLSTFLKKITNNQNVNFEETISIITQYYDYQPTEFSNGNKDKPLINQAGTNEGSCKIFSFAQINQLTAQQALNLFGDFYHKEVLQDPSGNSHQNIRHFIQFGWNGIAFTQQALTIKP